MEIRSKGVAPPRGLLHERMSMAHFDLIRIAPSEALAPFIENYWIILWDLTGKPDYTQQNLPHPSVNMVVVPGGESGVFGVQTGVWNYTLEGSGRIFGIKFRPGAFRPFSHEPVGALRDRHAPIEAFFGTGNAALEARFGALNDPLSMTGEIEALLLGAAPERGEKADLAEALVRKAEATPDLLRAEDLAAHAGMNLRALQRLFEDYVGVGPKWVIARYRLLEAVDALNRGEDTNLTGLAHDLGYFDQAHFTRTFKALTGNPPSHYLDSSAAR